MVDARCIHHCRPATALAEAARSTASGGRHWHGQSAQQQATSARTAGGWPRRRITSSPAVGAAHRQRTTRPRRAAPVTARRASAPWPSGSPADARQTEHDESSRSARDERDTMMITKSAAAACRAEGCPRLTHGLKLLCYYHKPKRRLAAPKPAPRLPSTTYRAVHSRLRREHGPASGYQCARCPDSPAKDWAYDHADADELTTDWYGKTVAYSTDLARYQPLCRPCHTIFDRNRTNTAFFPGRWAGRGSTSLTQTFTYAPSHTWIPGVRVSSPGGE